MDERDCVPDCDGVGLALGVTPWVEETVWLGDDVEDVVSVRLIDCDCVDVPEAVID